MARAIAENHYERDEFFDIHSKKPGEVGRLIIGCTQDHLAQLHYNGESAEFRDTVEGNFVSAAFNKICSQAAVHLNLPKADIVETEFLVTEPYSSGQDLHMDALRGVWTFFAPLVKSKGTTIKKQHYQDYPVNVGKFSSVPRHWEDLPDIAIDWEVGDLFVMRDNAIHGAPPNDQFRRYVLFGAQQSTQKDNYTDSLVVTERSFFDKKRSTKNNGQGGNKNAGQRHNKCLCAGGKLHVCARNDCFMLHSGLHESQTL